MAGADDKIKSRVLEIESAMQGGDFWADKNKAQAIIRELQELKAQSLGAGKYDNRDAIITIFSGAGGDDAEDFSAMLFRMYGKYFGGRGWGFKILHKNENDHGGFRNLTAEVNGKNSYGALKNESGVHRLVRVSPFNANQKRHTSCSLVEVVPKFDKVNEDDVVIKDDEVKVEFARSSGPGGQNVNKRETAVRVVHIPTNISAHVDSERSQHDNRIKAMAILRGKLWRRMEDERKSAENGMYISKSTDIEWGNQIRSYVMHPYKMVKDLRTGVETTQVNEVFEGALDKFIEAESKL